MKWIAAIVAVAVVVAFAAWWTMLKMPRGNRHMNPSSTRTRAHLVEELRRSVRELTARGQRNVLNAPAYHAAAAWIERSFQEAGYATTIQKFIVDGVECRNIVAELPGAGAGAEIVVIGAHYDSVFGSPGADDNASGVAGLLAIARELRNTRPTRTLRFVAFANEEPPHFTTAAMGSYVYAKACRARGERIAAMISVEAIGYFDSTRGSQTYPAFLGALYPDTADFIAFASNIRSRGLLDRCLKTFRDHAEIASEGAALPEAVPGIGWSDQWAFWQFGYDAIMVTDTALFRNPHYHASHDLPDTLDYERMALVTEGLIAVVKALVSQSSERGAG